MVFIYRQKSNWYNEWLAFATFGFVLFSFNVQWLVVFIQSAWVFFVLLLTVLLNSVHDKKLCAKEGKFTRLTPPRRCKKYVLKSQRGDLQNILIFIIVMITLTKIKKLVSANKVFFFSLPVPLFEGTVHWLLLFFIQNKKGLLVVLNNLHGSLSFHC